MFPEEGLSAISKNKGNAHLTDHGTAPREKVYQRLIPGPKRATLAAQKVRLQKLSKPFRPPAVQNPVAKEIIPPPVTTTHPIVACSRTSSFAQKIEEKMKHRTAKAAAQFKSPLSLLLVAKQVHLCGQLRQFKLWNESFSFLSVL
jgi:hypothetical protein